MDDLEPKKQQTGSVNSAAAEPNPDPRTGTESTWSLPERLLLLSRSGAFDQKLSSPRPAIHERGVTSAFVEEWVETTRCQHMEAGEVTHGRKATSQPRYHPANSSTKDLPLEVTPGQMVHGYQTQGPPDDWKKFSEAADPWCIRSLTLATGRSVVETLLMAWDITGDSRFVNSRSGKPFFGPSTIFASYAWHGMTMHSLLESLVDVTPKCGQFVPTAGGQTEVFFWIDIFAVAQNRNTPDAAKNNSDDVQAFDRVIENTSATGILWKPLDAPVCLSRVWCLYEIACTMETAHPILIAFDKKVHTDLEKNRADTAEKVRVTLDGICSFGAGATFYGDYNRIHNMIEKEGEIIFDPETFDPQCGRAISLARKDSKSMAPFPFHKALDARLCAVLQTKLLEQGVPIAPAREAIALPQHVSHTNCVRAMITLSGGDSSSQPFRVVSAGYDMKVQVVDLARVFEPVDSAEGESATAGQAAAAADTTAASIVTHSFQVDEAGRPKALVQVSADEILVGTSGGSLQCWRVPTEKKGAAAAGVPALAGAVTVPHGAISSLVSLEGGAVVGTGCAGGFINLWRLLRSGRETALAKHGELRGPHTDVWSLAELAGGLLAGTFGNCGYDADGEEVGVDGSIVVWNWASGEQLRVLTGHALNVNALAAFPDGCTLASAGDGGCLRVWNVLTGDVLQQMPRSHSKEIFDLKLSSCGRWLASASVDSRVRVWDTKTWTSVAVLSHNQSVRSIALGVSENKESLQIATGDMDGRMTAWSILI
jgi:WD40 repeat protein